MSLSIESLRCFLESARLQSFRAAARAVSLSPVAHSQRIKRLEEDLGAQLFHRTTRQVMLTEAGRQLVPFAERALMAMDDCRAVARGDVRAAPTEIVVGTRFELGLSWLVPMRTALEAARPNLTVHLYFGSGPDLLTRVRGSLVDCVVSSTRLVDPKLEGHRLHEESYCLVGSRDRLAAFPLRQADDAASHTLFDTTEDLALFRYWRDAPGGVESLRFGRVVHLGTIAAVRSVVMAGQGVAVLPRYFVEKDLVSGALAAVMPEVQPLSDHFRLVFRRDDPRRELYAELVEIMRAHPLSM